MLFLAALLAIRISPDAADVAYKQPQVAANTRIVALTYGAGSNVYFAGSRDGGKSFPAPVKVSDSGKLALGMHRGPRVAIVNKAIVISAVVGQKGNGSDGDLVSWRSTDGGKTWSAGVKVNDVPGAAREGLHSMASGGKNTLLAVWLDLRSKGTKLYGAVSNDGGASWSRNRLVYASPSGSVCECCHPTVLIDDEGGITVMFRNSLEGARDLYIVRSRDGGQTFQPAQKLGEGTWELNACPMDGGGLARNRNGQVVSVWRRKLDIFLDSPGDKERLLGTGKDPAIAVGKDGAYAAWTGRSGTEARVPNRQAPILLDTSGAFIQLVALPSGSIVAAWESKGSIVVQQLP
jgi:hypothetical protein